MIDRYFTAHVFFLFKTKELFVASRCAPHIRDFQFRSWASAYMRKWGQLTPWKMGGKLKAETCKKEQFSMFLLYFESNRGRQV